MRVRVYYFLFSVLGVFIISMTLKTYVNNDADDDTDDHDN